ncbi:MAG: DUF1566 domain-containing protein, partial [Bacteroidota bacterium]
GGIIFYLDETKKHGLVCSSNDIGNNSWSNAVNICSNLTLQGFSDWYLPSISELDIIYNNLEATGIVDLPGTYYWSSTECNDTEAKEEYFGTASGWDGFIGCYSKESSGEYIRAIRSF